MKAAIVNQKILIAAMTFSMSACGYYNETVKKPSASQAPFKQGATLGFEIVKTILGRNSCFECHTSERGNRGGINLETYSSAKSLAAALASTTASGFMPLGGARVSTEDVAILQAWADANAPEFSTIPLPGGDDAEEDVPTPVPTPTPAPSPSELNFAQVKAAIFTPHCVGCHSGFGDYARVAMRLPDIQRAIDTNAMPKGGPALSADLKTMLASWINQGAIE